MGLGKTVQTAVFLYSYKEVRELGLLALCLGDVLCSGSSHSKETEKGRKLVSDRECRTVLSDSKRDLSTQRHGREWSLGRLVVGARSLSTGDWAGH